MTDIEKKDLWEKCASFHGHVCGGLTIGYKAALFAIELLDVTFSKDEGVICISADTLRISIICGF